MKSKSLVFALVFLAFTGVAVKAQTEEGQSVVTLNLGYSLVGDLLTTALDAADEVNASSTPVFILGYDYGLSDKFSIGLSGTLQNMNADADDYTYTNLDNEEVVEDISLDLTRWQMAITPRFHYGQGGNLDMYSGLRIGITGWSTDIQSTDPDINDVVDLTSGRFSLGLTAFGVRYYFSELIGANMELNLGAPYIFSGGINLKF
ncbi:MAG: outer membrane beta-barrel protein [Flavobacteriales bacterium]|nr:outer membrane beta-barrel protein [Flavobacteriales bacterium]